MNKPCAFPGCPAVLAKGVRYCADHKQRGVASDDQHRPGSAQRGYNTRWHKLRIAELERQLATEHEARLKAEAACAALGEWVHQTIDVLGVVSETAGPGVGELCRKLAVEGRELVSSSASSEMLEALRRAGEQVGHARAILSQFNVVFDRWPMEQPPAEGWTRETVAALDPETRWQAVAFTLYSMLATVASDVEHLGLKLATGPEEAGHA